MGRVFQSHEPAAWMSMDRTEYMKDNTAMHTNQKFTSCLLSGQAKKKLFSRNSFTKHHFLGMHIRGIDNTISFFEYELLFSEKRRMFTDVKCHLSLRINYHDNST